MSIKHHGDFYNKTNFWQFDRWEELIKLLRATPLDAEQVTSWLDVGCGSGKQTKALLEIFPATEKGVGADVSATMLETARSDNSDPKLTYMELGAERIGSLNTKFDVVHSNFVLHWVKDKKAFFEGLNKVTEVGGYLMLGTCQDLPDLLWDVDTYMREAFGINSNVEAPFYYLDLLGWAEILRQYGWEIEAAQTKYDNHFTGDAQEFLEHWVTASSQKICYGHWYDDLSDVQKASLLEKMLEKYRYENENTLLFQEQTLLLVAKRVQ